MRVSNSLTTLIGGVTNDPELTFTQGGHAKLVIPFATSKSFKKDDVWEERTSWWTIIMWRQAAEDAANVITKGQRLIVVGEFEMREWEDKDGNNRRTYEITSENVGLIPSQLESVVRKPKKGQSGGGQSTAAATAPKSDPFNDEPF